MARGEVNQVARFERLYRDHWEDVCRTARRIVRSDEDAQDVAQQVFTRVWNSASWGAIDRPADFLRRAALNEAVSLVKRRRGLDRASVEASAEFTDSSILADELLIQKASQPSWSGMTAYSQRFLSALIVLPNGGPTPSFWRAWGADMRRLWLRLPSLAVLVALGPLLPTDTVRASSTQADATPDSAPALRAAERDVRHYIESVRRGPQGQESSVLVRPPSFGLEPPERRRQAHLEEASRRRPRVIEDLDEHALGAPRNDWIVGYRVAFRIKQGWVGDAVAVARQCEASPWWCGALLAWALHVDGLYAEAEAAMDASLESMPHEMRCRWGEELSPILQGALRGRFDRADCKEQAELADRLWWLADPLHIRSGNGRKTEHFVRLVAMEFHHGEYVPYCEPTHHTQIIQGGWPPWWFALPASLDPIQSGQAFLPSEATWHDPLAHGPADWDLSVRRHGERYMLPDGPISPLEQQTAFLLRGDSVLVASAIGLADRMIVAGVALSTSEHEPPLTALETDGEGPFRVQRQVPPNRYLVSVEAVAPGGRGYRTRFGHGLPDLGEGGLQMSDLLLFAWDDGLEHTFEDVFPHMLATERVIRGRPLGLYWETYGLLEGRSVDVRVQLRRTDRGFLHRFGERLGLVGPEGPVSVRWTVPDEDVQVGRHLRLDLSSQDPGTYEMRVAVDDGEGGRASVTRLIEIVDA